MSLDPKKIYPLPKFHFEVDWGGTRMGFSEISGLTFETEVISYREGDSVQYLKNHQPGLTSSSHDITLQRGCILGDLEYYELWKKTIFFQEMNESYRRDIVIRLLNEERQPVICWLLKKAWPKKVAYGSLVADANEILIESMVFVHEGLSIVNPS